MRKFDKIAILTGSGISVESGLSTFRGGGGIWEDHRVEDVATPEAFARDPVMVHRFYNMRRGVLKTVEPNAAHKALARLEREYPGDVLVITQNVDDLHERAGSKNLIHMHGEILKVRCSLCRHGYRSDADLSVEVSCPACKQPGGLRPDIVWFGEMPYHLEEIDNALQQADLFISIGTSGNVYPAAGFIAQIRALGRAHSIELNLEPSEGSHLFTETEHGPAATLVPAFVERLLAS